MEGHTDAVTGNEGSRLVRELAVWHWGEGRVGYLTAYTPDQSRTAFVLNGLFSWNRRNGEWLENLLRR